MFFMTSSAAFIGRRPKTPSFEQFLVDPLRLGRRLDAQLFAQELAERLVLLAHGDAVALARVRAHDHAVHVLAERVFAQDALGQGERARPVLRLLRRLREYLDEAQVLLAVVRAL